ncbi:hypothetical protein ACROYT_G025019 [Oculina patagonica]
MFKDHLFHALDGKKIETLFVETGKHCLLKCVKNRQCFSTNIGVTSRHDGKVLCELLSSDKYNSSGSFQQSSSFHHYSISSPCEIFPCLHGGTCRALYEKNDYSCDCSEDYSGKNCQKFLTCGIDQDWKQFNSSCYKYFNEALNWSDASSHCREMNGSLVILHTAEEHEFITRAVFPDTYQAWIGLNDYGSSPRDWKWEDGSGLSFSHWHPGEPNDAVENCVGVLNGFFYGMQWNHAWNDQDCAKSFPFICERRTRMKTVP